MAGTGSGQVSSHMLKTGGRGNPFCKVRRVSSLVCSLSISAKDTHDLFATLMVSLNLGTNSRFFKSYPNSFTTDDAAINLASLKFSQSNRIIDPNDSTRIVTTTTTTTFSMTREIAKGICQHFLDARLIENAIDPTSTIFKDRGIFQITPKGLHVLERFVTKNGISTENILKVFVTQSILVKLITLERRPSDDDIECTRKTLEYVWKRFAGSKHPNYAQPPITKALAVRSFTDLPKLLPSFDRSNGVEVQDVVERNKQGNLTLLKHVFSALACVDWLVDFTTAVCREEAGDLAGHFVRLGWMALHQDRTKPGDRLIVIESKADPRYPTGGLAESEFRWGARVTYRFTDEGRKLSGATDSLPVVIPPAHIGSRALEAKLSSDGVSLDDDASSNKSGTRNFGAVLGPNIPGRGGPPQSTSAYPTGLTDVVDHQLINARLTDLFRFDLNADNAQWGKEGHSSTNRLRAILDEPALRALFRDYLRSNYCEENLGFWLDVADFRRRFSTTSSASGGPSIKPSRPFFGVGGGSTPATASSAMEAHQQALVTAALQIYHTYLAPLSPNELNIDHNLRADVVKFIQKVQFENGSTPTSPTHGDDNDDVPTIALRATQVQVLLRHYERIQDHIFRLLATDQVPKFIRTPRFVELMDLVSAICHSLNLYR